MIRTTKRKTLENFLLTTTLLTLRLLLSIMRRRRRRRDSSLPPMIRETVKRWRFWLVRNIPDAVLVSFVSCKFRAKWFVFSSCVC